MLIIELVVTFMLLVFVVGILWLTHKNNIHIEHDESGLEVSLKTKKKK